MSKKRVEMYEEPLPDGRCNYRLPYVEPLTGKNKKLSIIMPARSPSNYKLALRTLQDKLDRLLVDSSMSDFTLGDLVSLYLEDIAESHKPSTVLRNKSCLLRLVDFLGSDVYISQLSVPYVRAKLKQNTIKPVTYNEYIKRFKTFLNWAYINDYISDRTLFEKLQFLPDQKQARITDKFLEAQELQDLLAAADHPLWSLVIRFLALSGLRIGELIALNNSDITDDYILVNKTYETGARVVSTSPKTASSVREVYLRPELLQVVNEIKKYMLEFKFKNGIRNDLFICRADGSYIKYDSFRQYLGDLSESVLNHRITPHALRHTAASLLIAQGVPLEVVSRMLGHDGSRITKQIYLHITQELKNRDNNILKNINIL